MPVFRLLFGSSSESDSKFLDICKYSGNFMFFFIPSSHVDAMVAPLKGWMTLMAFLANPM